MKKLLKNIVNRFGYDILHLPADPVTRQWLDLMHNYNINLVFDIGANVGQYAQRIRTLGYSGEIVSFEPMVEAYQQLNAKANSDPKWKAIHTGIGDYDGTASINVSNNSYSSSILDIMPLHIEAAPDAIYTRKEQISVKRLDSVITHHYRPGQNLFVKIDTQGFERQVFKGSGNALENICGFQMELSLQPLYRGETMMQDMIVLLRDKGFTLRMMEGGYRNSKTGELMQVEGFFFR